MADYKVGSLQIAFEAINNTSTDFKELSKNLRALQKVILNIANTDLKKFSDNITKVTKDLSPFLTDINKATSGLVSFWGITQNDTRPLVALFISVRKGDK